MWILASFLGFFACLIWWLIRQQKQRVWFPILRVIEFEKRALPHLKWVYPPWIPFVAFLIGFLGILVFSFKLYEFERRDEKLDLKRTHVIFDLSPSVKFNISLDQYRIQAQSLLENLSKNQKLSFSSTASPALYIFGEDEAMSKFFSAFAFHRAGSKIGSATEDVLNKQSQIERLIIVSDRDHGSWDDFNWRYLSKKVEISRVDLTNQEKSRSNVYIDDVHFKEKGGSGTGVQTWSVILRRVNQGSSLSGSIEVEERGKKLVSKEWTFAATEASIEMEVAFELSNSTDPELKSLKWLLLPKVSNDLDLDLDNIFQTYATNFERTAAIISPPRGEMMLDDSAFHLKSSLEVSGIRVSRMDQWHKVESGPIPDLLVSEVFPQVPLEKFCPLKLPSKQKNQMQQIWLVPSLELNDFGSMCHCFSLLMKSNDSNIQRPSYCEDLQTREQWVGVMQSLGARQVGGDVSSSLGALAMGYVNQQNNVQILGFTVPLQPIPSKGISFGQLPLIIRSLLEIFPLSEKVTDNLDWPRITDSMKASKVDLNFLSNVPGIESSLRQVSSSLLPPALSFVDQSLVRSQAQNSLEKNSEPWVRLCLCIIIASLVFEVIGSLGKFIWKNKVRLNKLLFFPFLLAAILSQKAESQVRLNTLGFQGLGKMGAVKREVSGRTSIELEDQAKVSLSFQKNLLQEPWLWVATPQSIGSLPANDWVDLVVWIKRGGFLVIENAAESSSFKQRLQESIPLGQWKPIPPDHELMRSFHLLSSLPQCGSHVWEGFHFDDRVAVLLVPGSFLEFLIDSRASCYGNFSHEQALRVFINIQMVALATDYKKDQIHLPEILKRLR